jgi:hypothetical protein
MLMAEYSLNLDYPMAAGWLADFVTGLAKGRAIARQCSACSKTSFPPERVCSCGSDAGSWQQLDGRAQIEWRTSGSDGSFALVQFVGADTRTLVALDNVPGDAKMVRLKISSDALGGLCVGVENPDSQDAIGSGVSSGTGFEGSR